MYIVFIIIYLKIDIKQSFSFSQLTTTVIWIYLDIFQPENCSYNTIKNSLKNNNYIFIPISKLINDCLIYGTKSILDYYIKTKQGENTNNRESIKEILIRNNDQSELFNILLFPFTSTIPTEYRNIFPSEMKCKGEILNRNIPPLILFSTVV